LKHLVCTLEELELLKIKAVNVDRKGFVVIRSQEGSVYALRDVCPHRGPCLSDGMIDRGCSGNAPGEFQYEKDTEVLRCPWHSWEFDIRTGKSIFAPEKVKVNTYQVTIEHGNVFIEV
jgi:nitrite reductase (NADH) small subunit